MKPIFETERVFLERELNIEIPTECWKTHTKIYFDYTCKQPIYTFEVDSGNLKLKNDNRNNSELIGVKQKKLNDLINIESNILEEKERQSVDFLVNYIEQHIDEKFVISHSSGKDSVVMDDIFKKAKKNINKDFDWMYSFANTSNETADTFKFIKSELPKEKTNFLNPKIGYYQWIKDKNYFVPSIMVRNCCSTYKEGQLSKVYDTKIKTNMLIGVRSSESTKRKDYTWIMDRKFRLSLFGVDKIPEAWTNIAPIIKWSDELIWLYIIKNNLKINKQYEYGYPRVGCLICPFQHDYSDVLTKEYYPKMWERWENILDKNYESTDVEKRLKWTIEEWKHGKWKNATSKEYDILSKKITKDRVKQLAEIKGISEELAEKYWNNNCQCCGKKLNTDEVAMNLKIFGRGMDLSKAVCGKCYQIQNGINRKEYSALIKRFRDTGCNLF